MLPTKTFICPTITADNSDEYYRQLNNVLNFTNRIHIDLAKYPFSPRNLIDVSQITWPDNLMVDCHIMINTPYNDLNNLIKLKPNLVIIHAEASGNFVKIADTLHKYNIKVGVGLLRATAPAVLEDVLDTIDHVLIFSGNLGYQGGSMADLRLLYKVKWLKDKAPNLEIGWDGGINEVNAYRLVSSGVNVLNVGGYIQNSINPKQAYANIRRAIKQ